MNKSTDMKDTAAEADIAMNLAREAGMSPAAACVIAAGGSDRRYWRLTLDDGSTAVATFGPDPVENRAFIDLARTFGKAGCNVPEILAVSDDGLYYLQQDLGSQSLLPLLATGQRLELAEATLASLVKMQTVPADAWRNDVFNQPFSGRQAMWDLNYFKYCCLKPCGITFDENLLQEDMERLASRLDSIPRELWGFMYRDCQSRNVMIREGEPWWIDFQGGRPGPMPYDAVSFLWQAKAGFTDPERTALMTRYASMLSEATGVGQERILAVTDLLILFRTLQVLGAYGFRGLVEKKAHFIESLPPALANLSGLVNRGLLKDFPELERIAVKLAASRFADAPAHDGALTVKVFSFSYKKGYPEDLTGNGGGFMFDCRGMSNPGRYEEYRSLTGLDAPVIEFLEAKGEVGEFVQRAVDMVTPVIERYARRGFDSLQVGFGCTGGQHRSVYCAQAFAGEVARRFADIRVNLVHRERGLQQWFNYKED